MATVTGYTADRMKAIEDASVVNGDLDGNGHLILTRFDGSTIDAGVVVTSPRIVTNATRPTTDLYEGLIIYETDTNQSFYYDGTNWIPRGQGTYICTSASRPANPFEGMTIYETNTDRFYVYTGAAWRAYANQKYTLAGTQADTAASGTNADTGTETFGVTFAAAPIVVASVENGSNADLIVSVNSITTTGFSYRVAHRDAASTFGSNHSYVVNWVAVGDLA